MSTSAALFCAWLASFKVEELGGSYVCTLLMMMSPGCFVSFIFVVWFCLLLFMQGCWVIEIFSA
jgi:hypothetical protein